MRIPIKYQRPSMEDLREIASDKAELILDLTAEEYGLFINISKEKYTRKDNFREQTIQRGLPPRLRQHIGIGKTCKSLANKGLLALYRPHNWRFTRLGLQVAGFLRQ